MKYKWVCFLSDSVSIYKLIFSLSNLLNMIPLIIEDNQIKTSFFAAPHLSIDVGKLKVHVQKYPIRWQTAFNFLENINPANLVLGITDLSDDVYVNVMEYETKTIDESCYESHRNYIDIQYVLSGQEYIAVNKNIHWLKIIRPYDSEKDYANYEYDGQKLLLADPKKYFIFFPGDAHMPCIKLVKKGKVKKVVIKIKYN